MLPASTPLTAFIWEMKGSHENYSDTNAILIIDELSHKEGGKQGDNHELNMISLLKAIPSLSSTFSNIRLCSVISLQ